MKEIYRDVLLQPQVPCPECGYTMMFQRDFITVYCGVQECLNYLALYRVTKRPRVDLVTCEDMVKEEEEVLLKDHIIWNQGS